MTKKTSIAISVIAAIGVIAVLAYIVVVMFQNTERQSNAAKLIESQMDILASKADSYFKGNNSYVGICKNPSDFQNVYNTISKPNPSLLYINCAQNDKQWAVCAALNIYPEAIDSLINYYCVDSQGNKVLVDNMKCNAVGDKLNPQPYCR
jgi:type II secretory pathway pseudopilin PulG